MWPQTVYKGVFIISLSSLVRNQCHHAAVYILINMSSTCPNKVKSCLTLVGQFSKSCATQPRRDHNVFLLDSTVWLCIVFTQQRTYTWLITTAEREKIVWQPRVLRFNESENDSFLCSNERRLHAAMDYTLSSFFWINFTSATTKIFLKSLETINTTVTIAQVLHDLRLVPVSL